MKNIPFDDIEYNFFRSWLRTTNIVWRDMRTSSVVYSWGEAATLASHMIGHKSCSQVAYDLMVKHFPKVRLNWTKTEFALLDTRVPQVFLGPSYGHYFYLDIKAAYWQFYRYLFLKGSFPFRRQKHSLYELSREFEGMKEPNWKVARNSIIGITRSTRNKWVCGEKTWTTPKYNRYLSPFLWATLMGILNQIASTMVQLGAIWVNTDGYLFPTEKQYQDALHYFDERRIIIGDTGQGEGHIHGLHSVQIPGVKETKSIETSKQVYHLETSNINFIEQWQNNRRMIENV